MQVHSLKRPGNITIGDYWGIEKVISEFKDDWGVSCLLVNDERGLALLDKAKDSFELRKTLVEEVANEEQPMLYKQPEKNWQKKFWGEYRKAGFEKACKKVGVLGWKESLRNGAKPWMKLYGVWAPSILKALWARRCNRLNLT